MVKPVQRTDGQVHRWLEQLSQFDYSTKHRPGLNIEMQISCLELLGEMLFCVNNVKCC